MTAYIVDLHAQRATVVSDTSLILPGIPPAAPRLIGFSTKVYPLPHLRAVLFGRGISQITAESAHLALLSPQLDSVERLVQAMPGLLRQVADRYCRAAGIADPQAVKLVEVYLAGWSETERRMRFWAWSCLDNWRPLTADAGNRTLILPPVIDLPPRQGSLDQHHIAIMKALRRFFEAHPEGGAYVGGAAHAWTLTPDGISMRVLHRFQDTVDAELRDRIVAGEPVDMSERLFAA